MKTPFGGIDHLGIAVHDLAAATETYRDVLGFAILGEETLPERGLKVQFVDTGDARIELLGATNDNSEISGFLKKRGEGIHHICVRVRDIDGAVATMKERGAHVIGDGVQSGAHGTRVAFVHPKTTHGVLLELVEHTPDNADANTKEDSK